MLFGRRGDLTKAAIRRPWRLSAKLLIVSSVATVIGFTFGTLFGFVAGYHRNSLADRVPPR